MRITKVQILTQAKAQGSPWANLVVFQVELILERYLKIPDLKLYSYIIKSKVNLRLA